MASETNEKKVQELINSVESQETIQNIQKLTSESTDIFSKPTWVKTYSVLDSYSCFVKCTIRVPSSEAGSITESYIKMDLFGNPPSYIKSFNYEMGDEGSKATLVFEDQSNVISDVLILRLEKYRKLSSDTVGVYLDVEYGYQEPDYFLGKGIDKTLKKKLKFTHTETFRLAKFTTSYQDLKTTYTFELEGQNTIENSETFNIKPYEILGSHPSLRIKFFEILKNLGKTVNKVTSESSKKLSIELKKLGIKDNHKEKERRIIINKLKNLDKDIRNAKKLLPQLQQSNQFQTASKDLTELKRLSSNFKLVNDSISTILNNKEVVSIIGALSTYIGEESVHPWDIFKYCYRAMMEQFKNDRRAPVPFILAFLDGITLSDLNGIEKEQIDSDTYLDLIDSKLGHRIFGYKENNEGDFNYLKVVAGIKVSNFTVNQSYSWEKLFAELFNHIKMNPNKLTDPKSRDAFNKRIKEKRNELQKQTKKTQLPEEQLRKIIQMLPKIDHEFFVVDTYSDSTEEQQSVGPNGEPSISLRRTGVVQKVLKQLENFSTKLGNIEGKDKPDEYIKKITDFVNYFIEKHENRKICYMILYEDLEGSSAPFNKGKWGNRVLQGYTYRIAKDNSRDEFFSIGKANISRNNFPDVISFNITQYDFQNTIQAITESNDATIDVTINGRDIKANPINIAELNKMNKDQKKEALKNTGMTVEEFDKKVKANKDHKELFYKTQESTKFDYLKAYRSEENMNINFSSNQVLTSGDENFADVARAKKSIEAYRAMMSFRATETRASIQILGEPQFDWFCLKKYIFVKLYNLDGSLSMFTGIYMIVKIIQNLDGGMLKTTLELNKSLVDPDQLGQLATIFYTNDTINSYLTTTSKNV